MLVHEPEPMASAPASPVARWVRVLALRRPHLAHDRLVVNAASLQIQTLVHLRCVLRPHPGRRPDDDHDRRADDQSAKHTVECTKYGVAIQPRFWRRLGLSRCRRVLRDGDRGRDSAVAPLRGSRDRPREADCRRPRRDTGPSSQAGACRRRATSRGYGARHFRGSRRARRTLPCRW